MTEFNANDRVRITNLEKDPDNNLGLSGISGRVELVPDTHRDDETPEDALYFVPDDPSVVPGIYRALFGSATLPVRPSELELITDSEEDAA